MEDPDFDVSRHLQKTKVRRPPDIIIEQFNDLIARRIIEAGQKLPAERVLAGRFDVSRGTVVENLSEHVLLGLINNILNADDTSPEMLIEVRGALEARRTKASKSLRETG
ncbi:GntR family transcriptional regulator [Azospirillum brasilense]|uniref:GntR family transcriptional regulator n=1 Tax=Azospirillum brasilense TaxID=192 RepID=UPI001EDC5AD3|nr:GntR family transcriptional regulator [Azospirillum brasilense]UKJ76627.1 GntR family transcriptional regulator [Azospirillum brasilense]